MFEQGYEQSQSLLFTEKIPSLQPQVPTTEIWPTGNPLMLETSVQVHIAVCGYSPLLLISFFQQNSQTFPFGELIPEHSTAQFLSGKQTWRKVKQGTIIKT